MNLFKPLKLKQTRIMQISKGLPRLVAEREQIVEWLGQAERFKEVIWGRPHRDPYHGFKSSVGRWSRDVRDAEERIRSLTERLRRKELEIRRVIEAQFPAPPARSIFSRIRATIAALIEPKYREAWG